MFELKIPSAHFVQAALRAGEDAGFRAAILIFCRGLNDELKKELINSWSDLDDITHKDILVLAIGISTKSTGVMAYGIQRNVIAEEVAIAYPSCSKSEKSFHSSFESLVMYANHLPTLNGFEEIPSRIFDSHGTTEIRSSLAIREEQLPVLFIKLYHQSLEYIIELGFEEEQLSPVKVVSEISKKFDSLLFEQNSLKKRLSELLNEKRSLLKEKRKLRPEQIESAVRHISETVTKAPDDLKHVGSELIEFLSGKPKEESVIRQYELQIKQYAQSLDSAIAKRLCKGKLNKAIDRILKQHSEKTMESEITVFDKHIEEISNEEEKIHSKCQSLNGGGVLKAAVKNTIEKLGLDFVESRPGRVTCKIVAKTSIGYSDKFFPGILAMIDNIEEGLKGKTIHDSVQQLFELLEKIGDSRLGDLISLKDELEAAEKDLAIFGSSPDTLKRKANAINGLYSLVIEIRQKLLKYSKCSKDSLFQIKSKNIAANAEDIAALENIYRVFQRPFFCTSFVDEVSVKAVVEAADDVLTAINTGVLYNRKGNLLHRFFSRDQFHSSELRIVFQEIAATLPQIVSFINKLRDYVSALVPQISEDGYSYFNAIKNKYGFDSPEMKKLLILMDQIDNLRNKIISAINPYFGGINKSKLPVINISSNRRC